MLGYYATQVSDGRDQQHVLPAAEGERVARVGVAGAGDVHVRHQGEPAHHAPRAAQGGVRRSPSIFCSRTPRCSATGFGPILFQLPPNLKKDVPRLRAIPRDCCPPDRRYVFEFRHESWFDDDVYDAMRERDIAMCIAEQADFRCPVVCTASWGYLRLHRLDYDQAALVEWARRVTGQSWNEAYVFFKHDEGEGSGPPAVATFVDACGSFNVPAWVERRFHWVRDLRWLRMMPTAAPTQTLRTTAVAAMRLNRFDPEFSSAVMREVRSLNDPSDNPLPAGCHDLRGLPWSSVDDREFARPRSDRSRRAAARWVHQNPHRRRRRRQPRATRLRRRRACGREHDVGLYGRRGFSDAARAALDRSQLTQRRRGASRCRHRIRRDRRRRPGEPVGVSRTRTQQGEARLRRRGHVAR